MQLKPSFWTQNQQGIFFQGFHFFIYNLFGFQAFIVVCSIFVASCGIFCCGAWTLWLGMQAQQSWPLGISRGTWTLELAGSAVVTCRLNCSAASGILVPQPGIEPMSPTSQYIINEAFYFFNYYFFTKGCLL